MGIYEELVARGLIAQVTDEEEIKNLINTGKDTVASTWDKKMAAAEKALTKTVDAYKENE